ncbi:MAG: hypothetical protein M3Z04_16555 [Chloroflexota bacterium]|nr:hypothetical protein [Chloroflexota bacterium]
MPHDELTPQQAAARTHFVEQVRQAGWDLRGWESLFAAGIALTPEATAEYEQAAFRLRLSYYLVEGYLLLELQPYTADPVLSIRFYPADQLDAVLAAVFAVQDTLTPDNDVDSLAAAAVLCEQVFIETPDGLEQIV